MSTSYLLEKLPHLKQYKLFFKPSFPPDRYHVSIENKFVVFMRKDKKEDFIKVCFDAEISKDQTVYTIKDKTCYLSLPILQDEYNDETDDFPTANELNLTKYSLIKCKFCENVIYNYSAPNKCFPLTKIYPLPSEYWLELSDIWFCCDSHQIDFNAKEIRAKKHSLLIGKLFIILHSNNVDSKAIKLIPRTIDDEYSVHSLSQNQQQRNNKKKHHHHHHHDHDDKKQSNDDDTSWDGVQAFNCYCIRCETLIGISYKTILNTETQRNDDEILDEYHLWKFELGTEGTYQIPYEIPLDSVYQWYSVENYFSTKILEVKNARTIHKFFIYDYNMKIFIKINVLSTKCFIKCPLFINSSESNKMAPVLKLLFIDSSHLSFEENDEWIKKQNGHSITSSTENCGLLLEYLEKYNKLYPEMIQTQKFPLNMKLTFLRLLSRTWI